MKIISKKKNRNIPNENYLYKYKLSNVNEYLR